MNPSRIFLGCGLAALGLLACDTNAQVVAEFGAGITAGAAPSGITAGPDDNLWFTKSTGNRIGRVSPGAFPPVLEWAGLFMDAYSATGTASNVNGILEPGEIVEVAPTWRVASGMPVTLTGTASNFISLFPGAIYAIYDSNAAYGPIDPGATANCHQATGDCYRMGVSIPEFGRPLHWDAFFTETLSTGDTVQTRLHIGHSFSDVPDTDLMYRHVETLVHNYVTLGWQDGTFRPVIASTREATAMFVARGINAPHGDLGLPSSGMVGAQPYECSYVGNSIYVDVLPLDNACIYVHYLASRAVDVSFECADAQHACPGDNTTRAAMAVLIAGAITVGGDPAVPNSGTYTDTGGARSYDCGTPGGSHFPDVLGTDPYCRHVNYLWARGMIDGFVDGTYGHAALVTRGQIAKFVTNGFALSLLQQY